MSDDKDWQQIGFEPYYFDSHRKPNRDPADYPIDDHKKIDQIKKNLIGAREASDRAAPNPQWDLIETVINRINQKIEQQSKKQHLATNPPKLIEDTNAVSNLTIQRILKDKGYKIARLTTAIDEPYSKPYSRLTTISIISWENDNV